MSGQEESDPGNLVLRAADEFNVPPIEARCRCGHRNGEHCGGDGLGPCDVAVRPGELCSCDGFAAAEVSS